MIVHLAMGAVGLVAKLVDLIAESYTLQRALRRTNMWNWFLKYGDKIGAALTTLSAIAPALGFKVNQWVTVALAAFTFVHNTFLPEPTAPAVTTAVKST